MRKRQGGLNEIKDCKKKRCLATQQETGKLPKKIWGFGRERALADRTSVIVRSKRKTSKKREFRPSDPIYGLLMYNTEQDQFKPEKRLIKVPKNL